MCDVCFFNRSLSTFYQRPHSMQNKKWNISKSAALISRASVWQRNECFPTKLFNGAEGKAALITHHNLNSLLAWQILMLQMNADIIAH